MTKRKLGCLVLAAFAVPLFCSAELQSAPADRWWSDALEDRLVSAGTNRVELGSALNEVAIPRREGLVFLLENMPEDDLKTLSAAFLVEDVNLAYQAWEKAPWHGKISKEMFLNDVLPYACVNEARDPWRMKLHELCAPMVTYCPTPGEAAQLLNQKLFPLLKVRYSTGRRRPHQSPAETMESGVATCTGLSILLVDACRAVGVPARVVGTPMWTNMRGNHTWVEIWDDGWHFVGAAEPDPAGLDRGWFVHDASLAKRDEPRHAIYATSFRRTDLPFPLVWSRRDNSVYAVNVTDRYAAKATPAAEDEARVSVKVLGPGKKRVVADVVVTDTANFSTMVREKSRGETADLNDLADFNLAPKRRYRVRASREGLEAEAYVTITNTTPQVLTLTLEEVLIPPKPLYALPQTPEPLSVENEAKLKEALTAYFGADSTEQATWEFPDWLEQLLRENEPAVRVAAWDAYRASPINGKLREDFDSHTVKAGNVQSPYTVKTVGQRPSGGWALFIAMHGGGNAPKALNDRQWQQMQSYYKDHPEAGGYLYVALRAPNDEWNGFYADYVYPLIDELILQFRLFAEIDPDKVFIMGYSHGGYGAYAIGPKMPDRFAAIHASAAAGTDGETTPKTLRSTLFVAMVGERDTMYGRYSRNVHFKEEVEALRGTRTDIYPVTVTIVPGNGHTGLPDRDIIADMYSAVRNPVPRELDWLMTDPVVQDFFWLHVPEPSKQQEITATCQTNRFVITVNDNVAAATVWMDTRLVDYSKPVTIELNRTISTHNFIPKLRTVCRTLARRGDPAYVFSASFDVVKSPENGKAILVSPNQ